MGQNVTTSQQRNMFIVILTTKRSKHKKDCSKFDFLAETQTLPRPFVSMTSRQFKLGAKKKELSEFRYIIEKQQYPSRIWVTMRIHNHMITLVTTRGLSLRTYGISYIDGEMKRQLCKRCSWCHCQVAYCTMNTLDNFDNVSGFW